MKKLLALITICISTFTLANHHGPDKHHQQAVQNNQLPLSSDIMVLLNQEMHQIKGGMESLVFASVSGNWQQISEIGSQIKNSYVMKQKLTKQQRKQLKQNLPPAFKQLDKKLHHYAGMLSHVAEERDIELVNYYIYKMNETCSACHQQFAQYKFAGFKQPNKHQQGHH